MVGGYVAFFKGMEGEWCIMKTSPLWSTIRVNTTRISMDEAKGRLETLLNEQYTNRKGSRASVSSVLYHPQLPDLLMIGGSGPHSVTPAEKEIYVDTNCGSSVMRGADVYVPGVKASNGYFSSGDSVAVYVDLDGQCKRGMKRPYNGQRLFLGNGVAIYSRNDIFNGNAAEQSNTRGIGIRMTQPIWDNPRLDGSTVEDWGFVQNLPSVVCGHVLDPQPGEIVLDMCAAPGGKSTHLAILMKDQGTVVCVDCSANRVEELRRNATHLSLNSIQMYHMNANDLLENSETNHKAPVKFPEKTFDRILLDAPCSCTGQRPFFKKMTEKQKRSHIPVQRRLLTMAYRLLKPGGTLVYSTCSVEPEENENQIVWFLNAFENMQLKPQEPFLGQRVSIGDSEFGAQKFDPRKHCGKHNGTKFEGDTNTIPSDGPFSDTKLGLNYDEDTIGFFIAKIVKI